jgi:hypothetical protein
MGDIKRSGNGSIRPTFVALENEVRSHIDTACAAYHLGRKAQTLRIWASTETGPVRPIRVNGRLAWPVAEICAVLQLLAPAAPEPPPAR